MICYMPSHIFRQAQYDTARGQSEPVEDIAFEITKSLIEI